MRPWWDDLYSGYWRFAVDDHGGNEAVQDTPTLPDLSCEFHGTPAFTAT